MKKIIMFVSILLILALAACDNTNNQLEQEPFVISAIPDQDPGKVTTRI